MMLSMSSCGNLDMMVVVVQEDPFSSITSFFSDTSLLPTLQSALSTVHSPRHAPNRACSSVFRRRKATVDSERHLPCGVLDPTPE